MWSVWRRWRTADAHLLLGQTFWAVRHPLAGWRLGHCSGWRDALDQALQVLGRRPLRQFDVQVWLSGVLSPAMWLVPPTGLKDDAEWRAWLGLAVASQHPLQSALGAPVIWTDANVARPTLATAIPAAWLDDFAAALAPHRLCEVQPLWSSALCRRTVGTSGGAELWTTFDRESVTCFRIDRQVIAGLIALPGVAELAQAQAVHARQGAATEFEASSFWQLDLAAASAAFRRIDQMWSEVPL